jgi:hypothetical protein
MLGIFFGISSAGKKYSSGPREVKSIEEMKIRMPHARTTRIPAFFRGPQRQPNQIILTDLND